MFRNLRYRIARWKRIRLQKKLEYLDLAIRRENALKMLPYEELRRLYNQAIVTRNLALEKVKCLENELKEARRVG